MALLAVAGGYFYSTGPGKLSVWKELLDDLDLRGDEHVLDIGCGPGAVLISVARRLPRGRATGADIWRLCDQTGNTRAAAERNAMAEDVSERVEFADADARDLPFPHGSFDVVLSNLTFSNIRGSDERARALREAVRVLRPGGGCASSMTAPTGMRRSFRTPDAWALRYVASTGGRRSAFPAIT